MLRIGPEPTDNEISTINIREDNKRIGILKNPNGKYSLDVSGTINCGALTVNGIRATFDGTNSGLWSISDTDTISYVDGSVGIGTEEPAHELDVSGSVNCSELLVNGTAPTFGGEYVLYDDTYQTSGVSYEEVSANITTTTSSGVWDLSDSNTISYTNGNVGIGTTSPTAHFHVSNYYDGNALIEGRGLGYSAYLDLKATAYGNHSTINATAGYYRLISYGTSGRHGDFAIQKMENDGSSVNSEPFTISDGNVGIGTTDPAYELDVSGDVGINGSLRIGGTRAVSQFMGSTDYSAYFENYIYAPAIINYNETGISPSGIVFGDNSLNDFDQISLITDGVTRVYINSSGVSLRNGNGLSSYGKAQIAFGHNNTNTYQHFIQTRHNGSGSSGNAIDFFVCDTTQNNSANSGVTHTMSLDGGNVGIGTTDPAYELDVSGNIHTNGYMSINGGALNLTASDADDDGVSIQMKHKNADHHSRAFVVHRSNADNFIINYNSDFTNIGIYGNVGIGTVNPSYTLHVVGSVGGTSFTTTSDDRLKSNEIPITDALESLMKLNPMTYDKYDNMDKSGNYVTESGLISQDIWYQVPEMRHIVSLGIEYSDVSSSTVPIPIDVSNNELLEDADYNNLGWSNTTPSGVKYTDLIAYLIKAVQELNIQRQEEKDALQASHDSLQASHDSLKNEMAELKALLQEKSVI